MITTESPIIREHNFVRTPIKHQVRCNQCGFEQYSAAPQPLVGCLTDIELDLRSPFIEDELIFLMGKIRKSRVRSEIKWRLLESDGAIKI